MIVAEAYYTLHSFYGVERKKAAEKLSLLLRQHGVKLRDADAVLSALDRLQTANVGFADAFLASVASAEKLPVASFDRDFDKLGAHRYEPVE
jgi:predicted nucleic acid-binding protein